MKSSLLFLCVASACAWTSLTAVAVEEDTSGALEIEYHGGQRHHGHHARREMSITPMIGRTWMPGRFSNRFNNDATFGLALEIPTSRLLSIEVEGSYGRTNFAHLTYVNRFSQYTLGANAKAYLMRGVVSPYILGGLGLTYYSGLSYGGAAGGIPYGAAAYGGYVDPYAGGYYGANPYGPMGAAGGPLGGGSPTYDLTVGTAQVGVGGDIAVADSVEVGARGTYTMPVFNVPVSQNNPMYMGPGFSEAAMASSSYMRLMGTVKVMF